MDFIVNEDEGLKNMRAVWSVSYSNQVYHGRQNLFRTGFLLGFLFMENRQKKDI